MKKYFFIAVTALAVFFTACNSSSSKKSESASQTEHSEIVMPQDHQGEHAMLGVRGSCEMCKETIESTAKSVEGVTMASWDMDKKELHLNFDKQKTSIEAVSKAIAKAGYETDLDKADPKAYEALPNCCRYTEN
jgi:Cu(I)/Ag(I) efflux system membrane fusion protein